MKFSNFNEISRKSHSGASRGAPGGPRRRPRGAPAGTPWKSGGGEKYLNSKQNSKRDDGLS